jgi:hypothetical protein
MIIAFLGIKRSGKDTAGDLLVNEYGFKRSSFAKPLKDGIANIFDFSEEQINGELKEVIDDRWGVSPREVLQIFGTDIMQYTLPQLLPALNDVGRKFWVKRFMLWYNKEGYDKNIVITDVRFQHEVDTIIELGGIIIKIERPTLDNEGDTHVSEMELQKITDYHYLIENSSTIENYKKNIRNIVNERYNKMTF